MAEKKLPRHIISARKEKLVAEIMKDNEHKLINERMAEHVISLGTDMWHTSLTVVTSFTLMNCGNVVLKPVNPDSALQRARQKRGELPLYRYHVLKVVPGKGQERREGQPGHSLDPVAVHWVRGHFKRYTEDRPLFGKKVGIFWWQPHLAGRAHERFVDKEYDIRA